ncbi:MAG: hypothetical protein COC19_06535 [SAR86 cluster bacterium]|uniref:DUF3619 domain-containing protein n=1 Tax=SAR86 cluster bacterium TaxID=2030880 RepID=A0A2A4MJ66_9GAMM|nr:MAG: hypothetical protein COC19_06535 [SAR86 cluster bacterium]
MKQNQHPIFVQLTKKLLDEGVANIDAVVKAKLDAMRLKTLSKAKISSPGAWLMPFDEDPVLSDSPLDGKILERLNQARRQALASRAQSPKRRLSSLTQQSSHTLARLYKPAPRLTQSLATAFTLAVVVSIVYLAPLQQDSLSSIDEISLIASAQEIELYENLDFYLWLADKEIQTSQSEIR